MMTEARWRSRGHFDWILLAVVYALSVFGILCIAMATFDVDASMNVPLLNKVLNSRSGMWQSIFLLVSPVVVGVVMAIPTEFYRGRARLIYYSVLALLVVTLLAGQVSNGLRGWMKSSILGRSIQPSEFAKLAILLMLARHLSRAEKPMGKFRDFLRIMMIVGVPSLVVLAQGETGTVIVIIFMFMVMLFFADVDLRILVALAAAAAIAIGLVIAYALISGSTDYRLARILAFVDPQKYQQSAAYQNIRAKQAIGAGQMTGVGTFLPGSWATLGYVPENSTDFIFTVVGESFGFVGCMAVIAAYMFITLRMIYLARFTQDKFGRLVIIGVMAMLFFHVFQNIAMNVGVMPITGIPLPFLSYGGSNFITNIAAVALVLNITRSRTTMTDLNIPVSKLNTGRKRKKAR